MADAGRSTAAAARLEVPGSGRANVTTGVPVVDHLLSLLARRARFDLALDVAPGSGVDELTVAGRQIGEAIGRTLADPAVRGFGSATALADDALAVVALERSERPLFFSNVDFSRERVGGLDGDVVSQLLRRLASGAGINLHLRLVEGQDRQHVLEAIFKALGSALGEACRREDGKE